MDTNAVLSTWRTLNDALLKLNETELLELMTSEQTGQGRVRFLDRIYGRYNLVRATRERSELFQKKEEVNAEAH